MNVRLAGRISDIASAAGSQTELAGLSRLELAIDTPDFQRLGPFWAAVWGGKFVHGDDWGDFSESDHRLPLVWFQHSGSDEPRQRWHPDVWVDPAEVQPRLDAALAAGGTLVSTGDPAFGCTLADPDGNKVCLCTWRGH